VTQVFVLGDSVAYGVGAERAGWADQLKQWLQGCMYAEGGVGEKYELFNFAYPGGGIEFVLANQLQQMARYSRGGTVIAVVCTGGNNAKAIDAPDNFASSLEAYEKLVTTMFDTLQKQADVIIALPSLVVVDEAKVHPKISPFTGKKSFFANDRIALFNGNFHEMCQARGIASVATPTEEWVEKYLYTDGLHPNQAGHERLYQQIQPLVEKAL
jgi:lysophospholipase L1-like esterase